MLMRMSSLLERCQVWATSSICPGVPVSVFDPADTSNTVTHSGTRNLIVKCLARCGFTVRVTCPSDGNAVSEITSTGTPSISKWARPGVYRLMTKASCSRPQVNWGRSDIPRGPLDTQHSTASVNSFGPTQEV